MPWLFFFRNPVGARGQFHGCLCDPFPGIQNLTHKWMLGAADNSYPRPRMRVSLTDTVVWRVPNVCPLKPTWQMDLICNVHSASTGLLWSQMYCVELSWTVEGTATLNQTDRENGHKQNAQLISQNPFRCSIRYFHYASRHATGRIFRTQTLQYASIIDARHWIKNAWWMNLDSV